MMPKKIDDGLWLEFGPATSNAPKWPRRVFIDETGRCFAAGAVFMGSEQNAFLCASFDGTPMFECGGHIYITTEWLRTECPKNVEVFTNIETSLRNALAERQSKTSSTLKH